MARFERFRDAGRKKPRSPSKMGAGPDSPSAASEAANTPFRAALAKRSPPFAHLAAARLPQRDVADPCQADGVRGRLASSFISLPAATAEEIAP